MTEDRGVEMTERLLRDAGVGAGMRVLDVGCGTGDVTCLAASLVGDEGLVVGIDRNERALVRARTRAADQAIANVEFVAADLMAPPVAWQPYDAVVGRRVLMYQPDRVAVLRSLVDVLRPGGVVAFQEIDGTMTPASTTAHPLHEQVSRWMWQTVEREGATASMGFELPIALEAVGLQLGGLCAEAIVQVAGRRHHTAKIVRAVLPRIVAHGVASEQEIDVETLDARLAEELRKTGSAYVGDMSFCAWASKPT